MNNAIKTVKSLVRSRLLLKGVIKTIDNETKEQRGGFLSMLLGSFYLEINYEAKE